MCRRLLFLVLAVGLCLISSAHAATIVWVSFHSADGAPSAGAAGNGFTEAPDKPYTDLLKANGFEVTRYVQTGTPDVAVLNAANLVIISRSVASASFQDAAATRWNTTVTAPMIILGGYTTRRSRLGFNVGSNLPDTTGDISLTINDPTHPIYAGIPLTSGTMTNPYAGVLKYADGVAARGVSIVTDAATPGGTVLATVAAASSAAGPAGAMVVGEWPVGATVTHDAGAVTDVLAGHRLVLLTGSREAASGKSAETAGMYDLYPDGAQMFLNAVHYMIGSAPTKASNPVPVNGALITDTWANLGWSAGDFAVSHDVYFSDKFDDVNAAAADAFRGNQTDLVYPVGFPGFAYPDGLVAGTTYYWRIDEVNTADPNSPWKGDLWSFSIPPRTAYNPTPADGTGSVALGAKLTWTTGLGAKLHTVYFGDDFDNVSNASTGGTMAATATYTPAALKSGKVYYWRVDETNPPNTYKGQVWSFTTVGAVGSPYPANGGTDAEMNAILTWTPSDRAASHQVYFGTDNEAVRKAAAASPEYKGVKALGAESFDPGMLASGSTFYWRIDEVNSTNPESPWKGPMWSFTTGNSLLLENFESYNDIDPPAVGSNRIFDKWIDGFGTTTNGALVGNNLPPYAERTIVHGGKQSMPLTYDNNLKYSEATMTLSAASRDWTQQGVANLTLWFRGTATNSAEQMYVALNGTAVVYNTDTSLTRRAAWTQWVIPLQQFAGVNLSNVTSITIGVGTKGNSTVAGGTGKMYFDDIRLSRQ